MWSWPYLMLDALLAHAALLDKLGQDYYALPATTRGSGLADLHDVGLPLERRERYGQWYYAASFTRVKPLAHTPGGFTRRFAAADAAERLAGKKMSVNFASGPDRSVFAQSNTLLPDELVWYAVGDGDEIARLLNQYVWFIGKKRDYGYGQLMLYSNSQRWLVEAWPADWSERNAEGQLTRHLPAKTGPLLPVRPPYFLDANHAPCEACQL